MGSWKRRRPSGCGRDATQRRLACRDGPAEIEHDAATDDAEARAQDGREHRREAAPAERQRDEEEQVDDAETCVHNPMIKNVRSRRGSHSHLLSITT